MSRPGGPDRPIGGVGHLPAVGSEGLRCPCGRYGHLEALAEAGELVAAAVLGAARGLLEDGGE